VLYKIDVKKQQYYLADPANGKCKYGKEYIQEHWINIDDKGNQSHIHCLVATVQLPAMH
jgi:hypothetical protein